MTIRSNPYKELLRANRIYYRQINYGYTFDVNKFVLYKLKIINVY